MLATQNPLEQEGTYPLPEAQLDRFLLQIDVGYPDREAERRILLATTGADEAEAEPVLDADELMAAQRLIRRLPVGESVVEAILDLVRSARPGEGDAEHRQACRLGPGPARQPGADAGGARPRADRGPARAVARRRRGAGEPVLKHRMALTFAARAEGETVPRLIGRLRARLGVVMVDVRLLSGAIGSAGRSPPTEPRRARPCPRACRACSSRRGASPPP